AWAVAVVALALLGRWYWTELYAFLTPPPVRAGWYVTGAPPAADVDRHVAQFRQLPPAQAAAYVARLKREYPDLGGGDEQVARRFVIKHCLQMLKSDLGHRQTRFEVAASLADKLVRALNRCERCLEDWEVGEVTGLKLGQELTELGTAVVL